MPDLLKIKTGPIRKMLGVGFYLFDLAAYEVLYRFSPARKLKFFNGGYLPLADDLLQLPEVKGEEPNAMMYHLVAQSLVADLDLAPETVLDVGCGQGGGMFYLSRLFPKARLTGTDRNRSVTRMARRKFAAEKRMNFKKATGDKLAFGDESFNFVLSVGAPTYFGLSRYISEAARVVKPGGVVAFSAGYRQGDHKATEAEIRATAKKTGLEFVLYRDITPNTFASLKADIPRRLELIKKVPWPFSVYGYRWADLPGSTEYDEYESGRRCDFAAVLKKP